MSQSFSKATLGLIGIVIFAVIGLRIYQATQTSTTKTTATTAETLVTPQSSNVSVLQPKLTTTLAGMPEQPMLVNAQNNWWLGFLKQNNYYIQSVDAALQPKAEPFTVIENLNQPEQLIHAPWLLTNGADWYVVLARLADNKRYYQVFLFDADWNYKQQFSLAALSTTTHVSVAATLAGNALVLAEDDGEGIVVANFSHLPNVQSVQQRFSNLHDLVDVYANTNGTVNIISQVIDRVVFTQVAVSNAAVQQRSQFIMRLPDDGVHVAAFARSGQNILLLLRTNADVGQYYLYPVSKNLTTSFQTVPVDITTPQPQLFATANMAVVLDGVQAQVFSVK